jgi:hypothetical protein
MAIIDGLDDGARRQTVAYWLLKAGFGDKPTTMLTAISWAECGCQEKVVGRFNTDGTVDRGCFQLNDKYQAACSDECAFSYQCACEYVWKMWVTSDGPIYHHWHAYTSGKYLLAIPWAIRARRRAARQIRKEN